MCQSKPSLNMELLLSTSSSQNNYDQSDNKKIVYRWHKLISLRHLNDSATFPQVVCQFDGHYIILVAYMNYVVAYLSEQHPPVHQIMFTLIRSTFDMSNPNNKF